MYSLPQTRSQIVSRKSAMFRLRTKEQQQLEFLGRQRDLAGARMTVCERVSIVRPSMLISVADLPARRSTAST